MHTTNCKKMFDALHNCRVPQLVEFVVIGIYNLHQM